METNLFGFTDFKDLHARCKKYAEQTSREHELGVRFACHRIGMAELLKSGGKAPSYYQIDYLKNHNDGTYSGPFVIQKEMREFGTPGFAKDSESLASELIKLNANNDILLLTSQTLHSGDHTLIVDISVFLTDEPKEIPAPGEGIKKVKIYYSNPLETMTPEEIKDMEDNHDSVMSGSLKRKLDKVLAKKKEFSKLDRFGIGSINLN
jgi:hypothetical protein